MMRKMYKSEDNKIVSGVIGGVGEFFDIDPTVLRLLYLLITIFTGLIPGIVAYILAVIIMPKEPLAEKATRRERENKEDKKEA